MELSGKHVLVLGLGESGLASARWCVRQGARVRVADTRAAPPFLADLARDLPGAEFVSGAFEKSLLQDIDLLVLSPGLSGGLMVVIHARAAAIPVLGEIELFVQGLRDIGSTAPILAITGTNGKTTTTALTGHLLRTTGKTVGVAGNISPAALTALMDFQDTGALPQVWVLELSSFQLETTATLCALGATVLNVSDDHLDRYIDLEEYASTKARVFQCPGVAEHAGGLQVLNRQDARVRNMALPDRRLITFGLDAPGCASDLGLRRRAGAYWIVQGETYLVPLNDLPISGLHNASNAMAALALCGALGIDAAMLIPALKSFSGLAHRVQAIAEIKGVVWYDDSKGTNVGATVAALQASLPKPGGKVVIILGGEGKGQDFTPLKAAVDKYARTAILIGRDAPLIEKVLGESVAEVRLAAKMEAAVEYAAKVAQPGDAVLLSPACASFDMFRNYEHRAEVFASAVHSLQSLPAADTQ